MRLNGIKIKIDKMQFTTVFGSWTLALYTHQASNEEWFKWIDEVAEVNCQIPNEVMITVHKR